MSFFGKVDKSTTGAVIKKVARFHSRPSLPVDKLDLTPGRGRRETRRHTSTKTAPAPAFSFEDWFVAALVGAGHCDKHTPNKAPPQHSSRRFRQLQSPQARGLAGHSFFTARRSQHTASCQRPSWIDFSALVDQYDTRYDPSQFAQEVYESAPGPQIVVSNKPDDVNWPPEEDQWQATEAVQAILIELWTQLRNSKNSPEKIYGIYRQLPSPRAPYLRSNVRHRLLRRLGTVKKKDEISMLRYLSVVDDMKANSIPLTTEEWNYALSYVATYTKKTTETEAEAALQMLREMENEAGVQGDSATFNILFDAATKAGKLQLAELIYKEMQSRGIPYNRFHHVSLIFHFGIKEDGEGVRKAYRDMVESGEIIDTVAMNAVIASLIRAREPQAAMQVYRRMVNLVAASGAPEGSLVPPKDWRVKRKIDRSLVSLAVIARKTPGLLESIRQKHIVAPDAHTYLILIKYHAFQAGHLHATTALIDEMAWFGLPMNGSIFLALFRGFAAHGTELYTSWTAARLESVWAAFKKARGVGEDEGVYMGKWVAIWAIQAFAKCSGVERAKEVWEEIESMPDWKATDQETDHVRKFLHTAIEQTPRSW